MLIRRILLAAASTLLAVGAGEMVSRALETRRPIPPTWNQYEFYRFDAVLGWANEPGAAGTFRRAEFSHPISINEHGMRDRAVSIARRPGVLRVAVLGDSFTWGLGVAVEDRFTERAEALLGDRVEILNFGVSGYAPVQYALMMDQVLGFRPDVVVIVVCLANDFMDNVLFERYGYYKPYAVLEGASGVAIEGYPLPNVGTFAGAPRRDSALGRWLDARSSLFRRAARVTARRNPQPPGPAERRLATLDEWEHELYADPASLAPEARAALATALTVNERLLRRVAERAAASGAELLLLPAPTKCEYGRCFDDLKEAPNWRALRALEATARTIGVPCLAPSATLTIDDFWEHDSHWRPSGHHKVAESLAHGLRAHARIPAARPSP